MQSHKASQKKASQCVPGVCPPHCYSLPQPFHKHHTMYNMSLVTGCSGIGRTSVQGCADFYPCFLGGLGGLTQIAGVTYGWLSGWVGGVSPFYRGKPGGLG